jgi:hypothetical protein
VRKSGCSCSCQSCFSKGVRLEGALPSFCLFIIGVGVLRGGLHRVDLIVWFFVGLLVCLPLDLGSFAGNLTFLSVFCGVGAPGIGTKLTASSVI